MAADGNGGGGIAAVRPPPPFLQAAVVAAGPSGGKFWPLQVRCSAVTLAPLLMVLLLLIASSCLQAYCFLLAWFQTRTRIIQNCNLAFVYCYIGAADTGWH